LLLVRRDSDFSVKFSGLSPLAFRLLQRIEEFPGLTGRVQLLALAHEAGMTGSSEFFDNGLALLQQLHEQSVVGVNL
jgi:hypothetical protein